MNHGSVWRIKSRDLQKFSKMKGPGLLRIQNTIQLFFPGFYFFTFLSDLPPEKV